MKFSVKLLETICTDTVETLFNSRLGEYGFSTVGPKHNRYAYRPGKNITSPLIVCHADTVENYGNGPHPFRLYRKGGKAYANSIALDDRLGVALMLHAITNHPDSLGECAYLVCDNEEIGQSTARFFCEDSLPNWMVELDRRGTDVVCYDYDTPLLRGLLESNEWRVGQGSFSDICYLESLGVCGFNMGVGYWREHSHNCFACLDETLQQFSKLKRWYNRYKDTRLNHTPDNWKSRSYGRGASFDDSFWDDMPKYNY